MRQRQANHLKNPKSLRIVKHPDSSNSAWQGFRPNPLKPATGSSSYPTSLAESMLL
ncbi:hypothetical protein CLIM01_12437 [Colletotrichum limetticola]|uniref:Uncharacterized protein n=1 Tax=Colletotrichum limetticola TaxID=1209924 RepID=A0ABQ9PHC1_9PEZI|nr:hypothetical protein CLIM01_12437 [Colletotrichum limetticola]